MDNPWNRLDGEVDAAWRAFCHYRDQGIGRKIVAAYRALNNRPDVKSAPTWFAKWATENKWKERARAWDMRLQMAESSTKIRAVERDADEWAARRAQVRDEAWTAADKLRNKALEMLDFPLATTTQNTLTETGPNGETIIYQTINHPAGWTVKDAAALIKVAEDLRRLAAGMETEITRLDLLVEVKNKIAALKAAGVEINVEAEEVVTMAEDMAASSEKE